MSENWRRFKAKSCNYCLEFGLWIFCKIWLLVFFIRQIPKHSNFESQVKQNMMNMSTDRIFGLQSLQSPPLSAVFEVAETTLMSSTFGARLKILLLREFQKFCSKRTDCCCFCAFVIISSRLVTSFYFFDSPTFCNPQIFVKKWNMVTWRFSNDLNKFTNCCWLICNKSGWNEWM